METERTETLKQLADANDLLSMLECLTEKFEVESSAEELPWPGIRLTIRQVREAVMAARENVALQPTGNSRSASRNASMVQERVGRSLADRVEQLPQGGTRARELVNHMSKAKSSGRARTARANAPVNEIRELE